MTQLDPNPLRERRRTWRDLPATPPVEDLNLFTDPGLPSPPSSDTEPVVEVVEPPRRPRLSIVAISALVILGVAAGGWIVGRSGDDGTTPTLPEASASWTPADVAAALGPAVVHIEVGSGLGGGIGSGVIYDTAGLVLTAHHVVASADEVVVRTADDRTFTGRVVARNPERDLAVIALVDADDLVAAAIAEPNSVEVGEPAIALGSPFGFAQSVTAGIISGLNREIQTPVGLLTGLIQTDAPINPGNSGGPLANSRAEVIGINTAIASMSGGNDGVGFAIPVDDFSLIIDEVTGNGGVEAQTVPAPQGSGSGGLIPGLDELFPGLDDLFGLDGLPGLDEMLDEMFGLSDMPPELRRLLEEMLGIPTPQGSGR